MKQHRKAKDGPFYEANFVLWFCLIRCYVRCWFGLPLCIFTRAPSMCNGPGGGDRRFSDVSLQNLTPRGHAMEVRFAHMLSPEDQQCQDHFIHDHFAYPLPRYVIPG